MVGSGSAHFKTPMQLIPAPSTSNKSFLVWGDNGTANAITTTTISYQKPAGAPCYSLGKVCYAENTNSVGAAQVAIPASVISPTCYLLTNATDPTFASGVPIHLSLLTTTITINGVSYYASNNTTTNPYYAC